MPTCSPGSKGARRQADRPPTRRRSARRCWRMPSRKRISRASTRRTSRRVEMGRHPRAGGRPDGCRPAAGCAALFAHRRGHLRRLSRPRRVRSHFRRRARRRTAGHARRPRAVLQRLQQRLNRKTVSAKPLAHFPSHLRAYDLLVEGERRSAREALRGAAARGSKPSVARLGDPRIDLSPLVPFSRLGRSCRCPRRSRPRPAPARTPRRSKA